MTAVLFCLVSLCATAVCAAFWWSARKIDDRLLARAAAIAGVVFACAAVFAWRLA